MSESPSNSLLSPPLQDPPSRAPDSLRSFDVYDTLLTRSTGSGLSLFYALGTRLERLGVYPGTAEEFVEARVAASKAAYKSNGHTLKLSDIYREIAGNDSSGIVDWSRVCEEELEQERQLSRPVSRGIEAVRVARAAGHKIAFVSDMYVPTEFLRDELVRHGAALPDELLLVSGDVGRSKYEGELFDSLLDATGISPENTIHHGDCSHADGKQAASRGIDAKIDKDARLNRYERFLDGCTAETRGLSALMAGSSRLARLTTPVSKQDAALRDVTAGVAAPVLVSFVIWLLQTAKADGRRRLYFVSRDGEVLLRIAKRLQPLVAPDMELRYLYSSRKAWFFDPGMEEGAVAVEDSKSLLTDFLIQEGLTDGTPSALVDVGWLGRTCQGMARHVIDAGATPPLCMFIGLHLWVEPLYEHRTWWFNKYEEDAPYAMHGVVQLLEAWCSGEESTLLRYERGTAAIKPVLQEGQNRAVVDWGLPKFRETVDRFMDAFVDGWDHVGDPLADTATMSMELVRLFWMKPTTEEAKRWGSFPVETNEHDGVVTLAVPMGVRDALRAGWRGRRDGHESYWRAAVLKVTPRSRRGLMKLARLVRKMVGG